MLPGTPARQSYTYVRNGTSDLYAALDVASGKVLTQMTDQHRAVEFRKFLNLIDRDVPDGLAVHVICDNASTHKAPEIQRLLTRHHWVGGRALGHADGHELRSPPDTATVSRVGHPSL